MTVDSEQGEAQQSFVAHLVELRNRILWALLSVLIVFICLVPFANELYELFAKPLIANLPEGSSMISTEPHGPFFVPFKFAFATAFAIAIPMVLYQAWAFIAPGLYRREKRIVLPLIISSTLLFYCGIAFAYYVVFPLIFKFFIAMTPDNVQVMTDISSYMSFSLKLFFAFGVAFEVPIATVLLARLGVVSADKMARHRPYVVVAAFVVGMLMTPPDIFSQALLALPVCILFEIGLFFARKLERNDLHSSEEKE